MTPDYQKVWETMNELEMVTSKICSAREILESALNALENHKYTKAETLMYAADEFLQYYLEEFDRKFKDAWNETVVKLNQPETKLTCDKNDPSPECRGAWDSFWEENYYPEEYYMPSLEYEDRLEFPTQKEDKVVKWQLPVEEDGASGEYFITFPDDLLEAANLKVGDDVEWVEVGNGSFILKKVSE